MGTKQIRVGDHWKHLENEGFLRIQQSETVASNGNPCAADKLLEKQENRWENNVSEQGEYAVQQKLSELRWETNWDRRKASEPWRVVNSWEI